MSVVEMLENRNKTGERVWINQDYSRKPAAIDLEEEENWEDQRKCPINFKSRNRPYCPDP
jgi:hypothetical protein